MAKARRQKLKVFRTAIGFHDAYVAAPSRAAALTAWGADGNLFAQGIAEEVTEAKLMKAPLARPGEVVRVARGSVAEHVKALGKVRGKRDAPTPRSPAASRPLPRGERGKGARPKREAVDTAERALTREEARHSAALDAIQAAQAKLEERKRDVERDHRDKRAALSEAVERARADYAAAMAKWAESG